MPGRHSTVMLLPFASPVIADCGRCTRTLANEFMESVGTSLCLPGVLRSLRALEAQKGNASWDQVGEASPSRRDPVELYFGGSGEIEFVVFVDKRVRDSCSDLAHTCRLVDPPSNTRMQALAGQALLTVPR